MLQAQFFADRFKTAAHFRFDVDAAEFATFGEKADIAGITQPLRQQRIGQVEDALEIEVPRASPSSSSNIATANAVAKPAISPSPSGKVAPGAIARLTRRG
jgi:hypothetical protein